jgi:hypothetical protein
MNNFLRGQIPKDFLDWRRGGSPGGMGEVHADRSRRPAASPKWDVRGRPSLDHASLNPMVRWWSYSGRPAVRSRPPYALSGLENVDSGLIIVVFQPYSLFST